MSKYLKKFETQAAYEAAQPNLILPNVSLIVETNGVAYNPSSPTPLETRLVAKFSVTDTVNQTKILNKESAFSSVEIDGVELPAVVSAYTFNTTGEHTVKYTLTDPTTVSEKALGSCQKITNIVIPDSVTSIGNYAFSECLNLTSINIPSGVTSIGGDAFYSCEGLTSIDIPDGVTSIIVNTFYSCTSLTSVTIPDSVTSIGTYAFQFCSGLTSIEIPSGVTSIGQSTFNNCRSLTNIIVKATTPPTLGNDNVFFNTNNCPIYVPSGSVDAYKSATKWSTYASRIQAIP